MTIDQDSGCDGQKNNPEGLSFSAFGKCRQRGENPNKNQGHGADYQEKEWINDWHLRKQV